MILLINGYFTDSFQALVFLWLTSNRGCSPSLIKTGSLFEAGGQNNYGHSYYLPDHS